MYLLASLILFFSANCPMGAADEKADGDALSQLNEAYVTAFNRQDATAVANAFTEDGDMLILTGDILRGREAMKAGHASFFKNNPKAKIAGKQHQRRFLTPDVVVAQGEWTVMGGPAEFPGKGLWTAVQVKKAGTWKYASLTLVVPVTAK
jgi:uncharacterized protein (TIGR02246 family)